MGEQTTPDIEDLPPPLLLHAERVCRRFEVAECEAARRLNDNLEIPAVLGYIHGRAGRRREANQALEELRQRSATQYVSPMLGALIAIGMGEYDQAFDWLEKAFADRAQMLSEIKAEPAWDPLRQDRRYADLLRRMDLLPEAESPRPSSSRQPRPGRSRKAVDSLAVLPLYNASDDPELEYLSDGITDSIIRTLSQLPRLRVMARSSVFRFKGRD